MAAMSWSRAMTHATSRAPPTTCAWAAIAATWLNTEGVVVSMFMHHANDNDRVVWRLMVVWVDDEFTQQMLRIFGPNLLVANATVRPIIGMHINLCIKYVGYFETNPGTTSKFGLSVTLIMSVFAKFTI
jgi:hypothetical protein